MNFTEILYQYKNKISMQGKKNFTKYDWSKIGGMGILIAPNFPIQCNQYKPCWLNIGYYCSYKFYFVTLAENAYKPICSATK